MLNRFDTRCGYAERGGGRSERGLDGDLRGGGFFAMGNAEFSGGRGEGCARAFFRAGVVVVGVLGRGGLCACVVLLLLVRAVADCCRRRCHYLPTFAISGPFPAPFSDLLLATSCAPRRCNLKGARARGRSNAATGTHGQTDVLLK